jgi:hypothetical protein
LLSVWREDDDTAAGESKLRFRLEDPRTGERHGFEDGETLLAFVDEKHSETSGKAYKMMIQETDSTVQGEGITLIVDFSNGVQKTYANLPAEPSTDPAVRREGMSVMDVLEQAGQRSPGLSFEFERTFVDRGGGENGSITTVDGVTAASDRHWQVWVNETSTLELRRVTAETVGGPGWPQVAPGDVVLLKLVRISE